MYINAKLIIYSQHGSITMFICHKYSHSILQMLMNVTLESTLATSMPHAQTLKEVMTVNVYKALQEMASIVQVIIFTFNTILSTIYVLFHFLVSQNGPDYSLDFWYLANSFHECFICTFLKAIKQAH